MSEGHDTFEIALLIFIAIMIAILCIMAGYELFKVLNPVICPEQVAQLERCVSPSWN